jgi:phosphoglycerate dehydrogenase-like enzyme
VLVLGLGGIGREAARLADALGMHVIGVRRNPGEPVPGVAELHPTASLPDLVPRVDAMVITVPLTDETAGLVDASLLGRLKPGAFLVNVGRGAVVDEAALVEALRNGRVGGAALDVFATEPLPPDSPLWTLPNVLISPHSAALSPREDERIVDLFIENLRRLLAGEPILNRITPDRPY